VLVIPPQTLKTVLLNSARPAFDITLTSGTLDSRINFTRASGATYFDATGTIRTVASNTPRFDYGATPGGVTNWQPNSEQPSLTNWPPNYNGTGATLTYAFGTEGGYAYMDVIFSGTATAASFFNLYMLTGNGISTSVGQTWYNTINVRLAAGSLTNFTALPFLLAQADLNSVGGFLGGGTNNTGAVPTSTVQTVTTMPYLQFRTNPGPVSATFRISAHMLGTVPGALSTYVPTSGTPANVGAVPLGLLMEQQNTNILLQSAAVGTVSPWSTRSSPTLSSGYSAPDGTNTAVKVTPGTSYGLNDVWQQFSTTSGTSYTFSCFVKPVNYTHLHFQIWDFAGTNGGGVECWFNMSGAGTIGQVTTNGTATSISASITQANNGWYRVSLSGVPSVASVTPAIQVVIRGSSSYGDNGITGDGTNGWLVWGAQVENGLYSSSYIPTTTSIVTRSSDNASMSMLAIANTKQSGIAVETLWVRVPSTGGHVIYRLDDGTNNNSVQLYNQVGQQSCYATANANNVLQLNGDLGSKSITNGSVFKHAITWSAAAVYSDTYNGNVSSSITRTATPTTLNNLSIGCSGGANQLDAYIRRIRFWPRTLSSAELTSFTT
jgi:hypothetical protein